jgi:hypothetical protein
MSLRGGPHDGEAETCTALAIPIPAARVIKPGKAAEGSLPIARRNAGAIVGHGKPDTGALSGDSHRDAGTRIADSVVDEVAEHPA